MEATALGEASSRSPARIADELGLQARATAWRRFMQLLIGDAEVRGMALDGASSPLVQ